MIESFINRDHLSPDCFSFLAEFFEAAMREAYDGAQDSNDESTLH